MIADIIVGVLQMLVTGAAAFLLIMSLSWIAESICDQWHKRRQARRDRIEAELECTEQELYDTIMRLADALAEERLAAMLTQREAVDIANNFEASPQSARQT